MGNEWLILLALALASDKKEEEKEPDPTLAVMPPISTPLPSDDTVSVTLPPDIPIIPPTGEPVVGGTTDWEQRQREEAARLNLLNPMMSTKEPNLSTEMGPIHIADIWSITPDPAPSFTLTPEQPSMSTAINWGTATDWSSIINSHTYG